MSFYEKHAPGRREHNRPLPDLSQYEGQWIAIVDKLIVATGASVKEVFEKARKDYPDKRPLIARAPTKRLLILAAGKK